VSTKTSNGFTVPDHFPLAGHDVNDVLVTIWIQERVAGKRGYKSARRLHRVTCRHVTRSLNAWSSGTTPSIFWDKDAAGWAGEAVDYRDVTPMRMCSTCGTDTLPVGVTFFNETLQAAQARRIEASITKKAEQDARFTREAAEARVRQAERKATEAVLTKYAAEIEALAAQYLAETEA
jgi:hypothetical protein